MDGEAALAFLRREAPYEDAPRPDLVLLDLNLPRKSGHEVLAELRADPSCTPSP
jgi:two-component system, chemotaxis family, response regulator Rcp1